MYFYLYIINLQKSIDFVIAIQNDLSNALPYIKKSYNNIGDDKDLLLKLLQKKAKKDGCKCFKDTNMILDYHNTNSMPFIAKLFILITVLSSLFTLLKIYCFNNEDKYQDYHVVGSAEGDTPLNNI